MDTRSPERTRLETIPASDLIKSWRSDFGIDVSELFEGVDKLDLVREERSGRILFEPPVMGGPEFYQQLRRFNWYHPYYKAEHAAAAAWAPEDGRVLDVGAGDGGFARHLSGQTYVGLETDQAAVEAMRDGGLDVRPDNMDAWRAAPDFAPADLAASFQVLEHIADPDGFVAGMAACLAPGGRLAVGTPDAESYVAELPDFMLNAPPHHVAWWTEAALRDLLERAGLRVLKVERFSVEPWERRLYWMAKIAKAVRRGRASPAFGRALLIPKALGWFGAWPLQWTAPRKARGSTMLVVAEQAEP
ncbi:MAG: class I SAM-dependent methyltransferase [Pseudomonadota bacterium]